MAIGTLFGSSTESSGLYGIATGSAVNPTVVSQTYFEWFIFITSAGTPATPTGGSWDFTSNIGVPPAGWSNFISGVPLNNLWFSTAFVDSRNPTVINWATPGLLSSQSIYATAYADVFTGNGSTTSWTLTQDPVVVNNTDVSINGVTQVPTTDYTISGTTLTTTTAAPLNAVILVKYRQALPLSYYGAASNVQFTPVGTLTATNVQAAIAEVLTDYALQTGATSIGFTPVGALTSTNVQAAIAEVVTDLALSSGSSTVGYLPLGTGAVSTTVQAKLRQTIDIFDFIPLNLQAAILARTSTSDVTTYIQAAITYASSINGANISFPAGKFNISATINWASYVSMYGVCGETPSSGITANSGTLFNWTAGNTGTMITVTDVREATLNGFCLDGQSGTAVVGILYTSTAGSSAENLFTNFTIRNCFTGVRWGTTGSAGTDAAQGEFSHFTIWSSVPSSWGFIVNSGNVGQQCKIEWGGIQCGTVAGGGAINVLWCNLLQIKRVFGGGTHAAYFIRAEYAQGLTIQGCSSEMWGPGSAVNDRHNDAYFLSVEQPPSGSATTVNWTITMIGNQINNPIRAQWKTRIASIGDSWGQCKDSITETTVNSTGYFEAASVGSKVIAINNGVNPASIDISTDVTVSGLPTSGWLQSAYVSLDVQNGSGWVVPAYNATNFTANVSTWDVQNTDVTTYCYTIHGTTMTVSWKIVTTSLGGIPNALYIKIPAGKLPAKDMATICYIKNASTSIVAGLSSVTAANSNISIQLIDGSNFAAASGGTANTTGTYGQITFEVS